MKTLIRPTISVLREEPDPRRRAGQLSWFGAWVVVTAIGAWLKPSHDLHGTHQQLGLPPCPSVLLFDRPCPGCGLTTSWTALIHGNISMAFKAHPLGPILYVAFTMVAWMSLYAWSTKKVVDTDSPRANRMLYALTAVFLTFGAVRMAITPHFGTRQERLLSEISTSFSQK